MPREPLRRAARPPVVRAPWYRVAVPAALLLLGAATVGLLLLAGGVLLGVVPYPGR